MSNGTEAVWRDVSTRLRAFIARRIEQESDAEDVLQDVFFRIHKNIGSLDNADRLEAWVYQITRNAIIDHYRPKGRHRALSDHDVDDLAAVEGAGTTEEGEDDTRSELTSCLRPLMEELPHEQREALILTEYEGLTQKAVAEKLELSLSGVKSRVQRGRQKLRSMLLECCHVDTDRRGGVVDYEYRSESSGRCFSDDE